MFLMVFLDVPIYFLKFHMPFVSILNAGARKENVAQRFVINIENEYSFG